MSVSSGKDAESEVGRMNKYGAKKVVAGGDTFDSRKEFYRWSDLKLLEKVGKIKDLKRQVKYVLIPAQRDKAGKLIEREVSYIADFEYIENGEKVVEDTKGYKRGAAYQLFTIKRKLMLQRFGIRVKET